MTSAYPAPRPRRIATVQLTEQMIAHLLGLPEGVRIIGVRDEFASMSVLVMVEGEQLKVCPPGAMPERLAGSWVHERTDAGESVLRYVPPTWPTLPGGAVIDEGMIEP